MTIIEKTRWMCWIHLPDESGSLLSPTVRNYTEMRI
jgi:hypothetical protein